MVRLFGSGRNSFPTLRSDDDDAKEWEGESANAGEGEGDDMRGAEGRRSCFGVMLKACKGEGESTTIGEDGVDNLHRLGVMVRSMKLGSSKSGFRLSDGWRLRRSPTMLKRRCVGFIDNLARVLSKSAQATPRRLRRMYMSVVRTCG